jgi:hypothetical protein
VLNVLGEFNLYHNDELKTFGVQQEMMDYITTHIRKGCSYINNVVFSTSPYDI